MKVLVCGGRDYADAQRVAMTLVGVDAGAEPITAVISGCAPGADTLGERWAIDRGIDVERYPADWAKHGRAAGSIRNQQMLDEGKPDLVVAFPGGRGTADMVRRAKAAGVAVVEVTP